MERPLRSAEFAQAEELEHLRRRAYGPDADIEGDAVAQARLAELEVALRRRLASVHAAAETPDPVRDDLAVPGAPEKPGSASTPLMQAPDVFAGREPADGSASGQIFSHPSSADSDAVDRAGATLSRGRRYIWAILAGGVVVLALIAFYTTWASRLIADVLAAMPSDVSRAELPAVQGTGGPWYVVPAPDDVLALTAEGAEVEAPKDPHGTLDALGLRADELRHYESFGYLSVWSGESRYGTTCLLVFHPGQGLQEGVGDVECSPDGLDAIAELELCTTCSDSALFRGQPPGSLIRFVLKDHEVEVYRYVRAGDPSSSQG